MKHFKYLKHLDLTSTDLLDREHEYLDNELRHESWCRQNKGGHGRNISVYEAINIFKNEVYDIALSLAERGNGKLFKLLKSQNGKDELDIARAKQFPIEELMIRYGMDGRRGAYLCPFHEDKNPSMTLKFNRFRCWACGASGDTIDFVMRMGGMNFIDAVKSLT